MALSLSHRSKEWRFPFIFVAVTTLVTVAAVAAFFLLTTNGSLYADQAMIVVRDSQEAKSPPDHPVDVPTPEKTSERAVPSNPVIAPRSTPTSKNTTKKAPSLQLAREEEPAPAEADGGLQMDWRACGGRLAADYIPCLDNFRAIKKLKSRRHMEHRERHCPNPNLRCLVPLPKGYMIPIPWPRSRDMIWYNNVPHSKLVDYKKDQNWVKLSGQFLVFPGGGTQFKDGVGHYIQFLEKIFPSIKFGLHTRVVMDVGCGVASFGGYLLDRDVLTMSFAPKDEHEAQIQMALERGIPAFLSVIGTQRLTFPSNVYDMVHCARCRVHWYGDGGRPLLEINRVLRPGGYFVWSAAPVYRDDPRHTDLWKAMVTLTTSMCWKTVANKFDKSAGIGVVIYQKPMSSTCYKQRASNDPPLCDGSQLYNGSWYTPLESCILPLPSSSSVPGYKWPQPWPRRLKNKPTWLSKPVNNLPSFDKDTENWERRVSDFYLQGLSLNWTSVRNIMDMNAGYGGFAAALIGEPVWVMNVVPVSEPDTLPTIFERGLIGIYHDWCESFNTYPRTYDLLHAYDLFTNLPRRCDMIDTVVEMDRILRPGGYALIKDSIPNMGKLRAILLSLHWKISFQNSEFLVGRKSNWRPTNVEFN
ncbi:unnamed protein product [Victoria cruziana]